MKIFIKTASGSFLNLDYIRELKIVYDNHYMLVALLNNGEKIKIKICSSETEAVQEFDYLQNQVQGYSGGNVQFVKL